MKKPISISEIYSECSESGEDFTSAIGILLAQIEVLILKKYINRVINFFNESDENKCTIVNLGCGSGAKLLSAINSYPKLDLDKLLPVASDLNFDALIKLQNQSGGEISVLQHDINLLSFQKNSFDAISVIQAISSVKYFQKFTVEIRRLIKDNGFFIFTISNRKSYKGFLYRLKGRYRESYYLFSLKEIVEVLNKNDFGIVEIIGYNYLPFNRNSNSRFIPRFAFIENFLRGVKSLVKYSPNLIIICQAN